MPLVQAAKSLSIKVPPATSHHHHNHIRHYGNPHIHFHKNMTAIIKVSHMIQYLTLVGFAGRARASAPSCFPVTPAPHPITLGPAGCQAIGSYLTFANLSTTRQTEAAASKQRNPARPPLPSPSSSSSHPPLPSQASQPSPGHSLPSPQQRKLPPRSQLCFIQFHPFLN